MKIWGKFINVRTGSNEAEIDISAEELARQLTPMQLLDITVAQQEIMIPQSPECACGESHSPLYEDGKSFCGECGKLIPKMKSKTKKNLGSWNNPNDTYTHTDPATGHSGEGKAEDCKICNPKKECEAEKLLRTYNEAVAKGQSNIYVNSEISIVKPEPKPKDRIEELDYDRLDIVRINPEKRAFVQAIQMAVNKLREKTGEIITHLNKERG